MKEYNEETHFLMSRKVSGVYNWGKFLAQILVGAIVLVGALLLLLWALLQVVLLFLNLI